MCVNVYGVSIVDRCVSQRRWWNVRRFGWRLQGDEAAMRVLDATLTQQREKKRINNKQTAHTTKRHRQSQPNTPIIMESDALRSVRHAYYLGLHSEVAKEVAQIEKSNKEALGQNPTTLDYTNVFDTTNRKQTRNQLHRTRTYGYETIKPLPDSSPWPYAVPYSFSSLVIGLGTQPARQTTRTQSPSLTSPLTCHPLF